MHPFFVGAEYEQECSGEIKKGIESEGLSCSIFNLKDDLPDKKAVEDAFGIIVGTPVYLASALWQVKKWLEEDSLPFCVGGKLGGAFATAHYAQGGADSAIMEILGQMLVKGMLAYSGVKGMLAYSGGSACGLPFIHHGPVALDREGDHFDRSREMFRIFGSRFALKIKELGI